MLHKRSTISSVCLYLWRLGLQAVLTAVILVVLFTYWPGVSSGQEPTVEQATEREALEFFEKMVRPLLVERCSECHGREKQESDLSVDSGNALRKGGISGPAVLPGRPNDSLLISAVEHRDGLEMPPGEKLSESEIAALRQWIQDGAVWPEGESHDRGHSIALAAEDHWAFQPLAQVATPDVSAEGWITNPIDAFILQRLQAAGLTPSAQADRATLIRRVCYTLTGLPPTNDQVQRFIVDQDPGAYENLVEELLASPAYGEHWARHWLDVARYSDTKGYVYAREERFWTHAWTYRDWVVRSMNNDLPIDRFFLLQLAADEVKDAEQEDLAAMGFLTLGRRFLGVRRDIIDDQIDVVTRGMQGLTVGCARCHDHKFDPIPTADYYSLYGVFDSCVEQQVVLSNDFADAGFAEELSKRQAILREKLTESKNLATQRIRERLADYLYAQSELERYPADGFDQVFSKDDLLPAIVRHWSRYLQAAAENEDKLFDVLRACKDSTQTQFDQQFAIAYQRYRDLPDANPRIVEGLAGQVASFKELCQRYAAVMISVEQEWHALVDAAAKNEQPLPVRLPDASAEAIRNVLHAGSLHGVPGPCQVPDGGVSNCELFFDTDTLTELWKLQGEVDRWLNQGPEGHVAVVLRDRPDAIQPQVFRRGNPTKPGEFVARHYLTALTKEPQAFTQGSGRLELARAIVDPQNPLTARVFVNRVWMHHMGAGLVRTPSDFGLRATAPSHPELLDWLAREFMENGWSLKDLHRKILLSSTFRQSSLMRQDPSHVDLIKKQDPENRLFWRMNPKRLTFEELRDTLLQVSGQLDTKIGGRPVDLFTQPFPTRRTLYGIVDRQFFPGALRMFDFANPDLHIAKRNETTVPQQALFFLNSPLVLQHARVLAEQCRNISPRDGLVELYQTVFQRMPDEEELSWAQQFLKEVPESGKAEANPLSESWSYGTGRFDDAHGSVAGFVPLPHFTGQAWQGGSAYPDSQWGWAQLTATGGHPGNTREVAAIRRWTAPKDMTISIVSHWQHQEAPGDGIRVFLVSSEQGVLRSITLHQKDSSLNVEALPVQKGATFDFVVDIDQVLNSDQYLCNITIAEELEDVQNGTAVQWNSQKDFTRAESPQLDAWEQLAHLLICTNEFLFVD